MIPKKIHYCWFGGTEYPLLVKKCMETWDKFFPDFEFKLWNESNYSIEGNPVIKKAYLNKNWAFVSDYVRLDVLYREGGIYLDTDVEVINSFSSLLEENCFIGYSQKRFVNNAVMGGVAGHYFFKEAMEFMIELFVKDKMQITSPRVSTKILEKHGLKEYGEQRVKDIKVLPKESFFPYNPYDPERPLNQLLYRDIKSNTYSIHHYLASWNKRPLLKEIIYQLKNRLKS